MNRTLTILYKASHYHREKIFIILVISIFFVAGMYIFLLEKAIINVVQRQKVKDQTVNYSLEVSDLEERYFSIKNTVTLELAHSKGLKDAEITSYISKKSLTAMASNNEI